MVPRCRVVESNVESAIVGKTVVSDSTPSQECYKMVNLVNMIVADYAKKVVVRKCKKTADPQTAHLLLPQRTV